jgi:hypothetical protein
MILEHLVQMAGKIALVHKIEEGHLLQNGDVNIDKAPHGQEGLDQFCLIGTIIVSLSDRAFKWNGYFSKNWLFDQVHYYAMLIPVNLSQST